MKKITNTQYLLHPSQEQLVFVDREILETLLSFCLDIIGLMFEEWIEDIGDEVDPADLKEPRDLAEEVEVAI